MAGSEKLCFDPKAVNTQGNAADAIFDIRKGKIKLTVPSEQGKAQVIEILEAGDFRVAGQLLCVSTVATMTECVTLDQAEQRREATLTPRERERSCMGGVRQVRLGGRRNAYAFQSRTIG